MAGSIARDAREAHRLFSATVPDKSRFVILQISKSCATCHLKEPAKKGGSTSSRLFKNIRTSHLNSTEMAHFKVMTRQFEAAAKIYEDKLLTAEGIESEIFKKFLIVALRVLRAPERVAILLRTKIAKGKLPPDLKGKAKVWEDQLQRIEAKRYLSNPTLSAARILVSEVGYQPAGEDLILRVAASSILHQLVNRQSTTDREASEMYYYLAKIEEPLANPFWISEIENYLEQAIRPRAP